MLFRLLLLGKVIVESVLVLCPEITFIHWQAFVDPDADYILTVAEHRHVGSNNFNLFSSRSHTIFTLVSGSGCSLCYISLFDLKVCLSCAH